VAQDRHTNHVEKILVFLPVLGKLLSVSPSETGKGKGKAMMAENIFFGKGRAEAVVLHFCLLFTLSQISFSIFHSIAPLLPKLTLLLHPLNIFWRYTHE